MALVLKDRVKETTTTTGTGSFSLAGAVTGYDSFGQIGNGNTTYYAVYLDGGSEWEVGLGTYTSPSTLARTTILASSNAGSAVNFSAGQKTIWCDYPAGKAAYQDANGVINNTTFSASTKVVSPYFDALNSAGGALRNATGTNQLQWGAGGGNNLSLDVSTNMNGTNAQIDISPTGTGHVHIKPTGAGSLEIAPTNVGTINNMTIGATTPKDASFVNLSVTGTTSFDGQEGTAGQVLTSAGSGNTPTWTTPTTGTVTSVAATGGTGISVSGSPITSSGTLTITNTAPDQVVAISAGTGISVTGTYPSFTVTNSGVTSVSGTSPIVSSGGTTPAISIPAATSSVNGYLTSTDWTTFNNKAAPFTYTTNYIPYGQGTTTPNQSANLTYDGTTLKAQAVNATNGIVVNKQTVSANYTIASGDSGMSAGPVTVASGVTVTVSSGSRWVVL